MPIDLDMLFSASGHGLFAFGDDRFSVTNAYDGHDCSDSLSVRKDHFLIRSHPKPMGFIRSKSMYDTYDANPKPESGTISKGILSYGARKKKVSFADDRGFDLVEVREIPGPGGHAKKWADEFLTYLIGGEKPCAVNKRWKLAFEHPPWDDDELESLLAKNSVVLESVECSTGDVFSGRIKVNNLAFEKGVFLRITFDRWATCVDVKATYSQSKTKQVNVLYDTFNFSVDIPSSASRYNVVEFCVGFRCNGHEYWDNNGGINYRLTTETGIPNVGSKPEESASRTETPKVHFSVTANFDEFPDLGAWNPFVYNRPYW